MTKQMKRENEDVTGEQCVRNNEERMAVGNEIKEAWREQYSSLLNVEFDWDREGFETAKVVLDPWPLTDTEMLGKAIGKLKFGKAAGVTWLAVKMLKVSGYIGVS